MRQECGSRFGAASVLRVSKFRGFGSASAGCGGIFCRGIGTSELWVSGVRGLMPNPKVGPQHPTLRSLRFRVQGFRV